LKKPFRKNYTPEEKVAILRRHLIEKESVSDICDRYQLQPTVFHWWLREFFENGAALSRSQAMRTEVRGVIVRIKDIS
jgi:transposase